MPNLDSRFNEMDDPRGGNAPRHKFCDLMTISLLCALCGGDTAVDMELFGQMKGISCVGFLSCLTGYLAMTRIPGCFA